MEKFENLKTESIQKQRGKHEKEPDWFSHENKGAFIGADKSQKVVFIYFNPKYVNRLFGVADLDGRGFAELFVKHYKIQDGMESVVLMGKLPGYLRKSRDGWAKLVFFST